MAYKKHILLGKITKVHGYEGAVTIRLERNFPDNIPEMESVFIEIDGRPVPFFIDYSDQPDHQTLRFKFIGYNSSDKVREFIGCKIYSTLPINAESRLENPDDLVGYKVFSGEKLLFGTISAIIQNPGQLLLEIISPVGKNIFLPLHEDLVKGIDSGNKIIQMIIPEGIDEIN